MMPVLPVGPLVLPLPPLLWLAGLWLGLSLAEKWAARFNSSPNDLYNLAFVAFLSGLVGGRLGYLAQYPAAFAADPWGILGRDLSALDPASALGAAGIAMLIYGQRKRLALWPTLDALTLALMVLGVTAALANLASGAGFGLPTNLPWAIDLFGAMRHPTQVYEALAALAILIWLWPRKNRPDFPPGVLFLLFVGGSALARLVFEALRGDSVLILGGLRAAQLAAWLALVLVLWLLPRRFAIKK